MISKLQISGFKSLVDEELVLSNLNLLAGLNNSGKSSIIQALRMFAASSKGGSPLLGGHGSFADLRSSFVSQSATIKVSLSIKGKIYTMDLSQHYLTRPCCSPEFMYVGADRLGPQPFLPLNMSLDQLPTVGDRGEFVFDFIKKFEDNNFIIPECLHHQKSQGRTFEYVLRAWLEEISPGVDFVFSANRKADISHAEINSYRPANVGFGLSYTLPIIAATLGAAAKSPDISNLDEWIKKWAALKEKNGVLLVLENPEAHLHPKGQTAMGKMIALAASCGVQIIVETHSEHVMDGVRIAVKEGELNSESVRFHYLSKSSDGRSRITSPNIDKYGKLDFWPEGFFDQTLINRSILAKRD